MTDQARLKELLLRWQESQRQGRIVTAEELCADCPELLGELLRRHIAGEIPTASILTSDSAPPALAPTADPPVPPAQEQRRTGGLSDTSDPPPPERPAFQADDEPVPGYRLVRRLGKGGFGEVWEATGPGGFQVAFKFVSLAGRAGAIEQKALMVIRNIRHPNLLSIFGVWQLDGWLAVGMELADRTLHDRLKEALDRSLPGIPRRELVRYVLDAAAVIDYLNKPRHFLDGGKPVGIQHGDVKPQNIFLIGEGVKVGDFGLVRLLERAVVQHEGGLTRAYAAPEVLAGQMSRWSDQFALAVTYCFLRGGRLPFTGLDRDRPDLSMLPEEECAAVRRALERDPRQRWPSCRAFVKALAESKRPPSPAPPVVPTPVPVVTTETTVPPEPPRPFRPRVVPRKLRVIAGPDTEKVFELPPSGTVFLGRDKERTLTKFTERTISRTHCRLEVSGERVLLINESLAGTLVNERPVTQHELKSGDLIRLGEESQTKLVFEVEEETATIRGGKLYSLRDDRSLVGKTVGHFQIVKLLDASPSGTTYRARDTSSNRDVALKVFVPDRSLPERFRMMQPVLGLQHPNLLTLYEAGEHEVGYWVAMECAEGASLEQLQERIGPTGSFVWHQVVRFALQAAEGLNALHQREIVHRAITPRALLLGRSSNELKLGGLWRARALADCKMDSADTQDVLRHVRYMPPERAGFGKPATVRGDLYSLGAVLYHLLTGRPPFIGESDKAIIFHIVQTEPLPLGHFQPTIPRPLAQIVLRLLAKRPEDRYQSAQELLMALQPLAGIEVYQEPIRPVPLLPSRGTGENLDLEATPPPEAPDHPEPPAPAPGPVGAGRYQIVRELGLGGLGVVYLARDTRLDRLVALKLFPFASGENSEAMLRFARDAVWASKLDHPNICPVLDVYENAGRLVVVMAYIEGESLAKAIRREQPMAQRRVLEFVAKLARTLDFAHKRGVLHGDLKPANVIIDHRGEPILMDLGRGFRPLQNLHATQEGSLMGTPAYLSPEQVRGAVKEVGPASDQWSLGVILYEMLTGQVPFQGTVGHVLASIINRKPRPPRDLRPDIDPVLEAICLKAMSANMAERFPSMADCAQALENTVAICPTPGADLGPAPAAAPPTVGSDAASTPAFGGVFRQVSKRSMDAPGSGNLTVGSRPEWKRAGPAWESTSPLKRGRLWWRLLGAVLCCASFGLVLLLSSVLTKPAAERPTSETSGLLPLLLLGGALFAALLGILLWRWRSRKGWGEVMFGMARTARDTQPEAPVEVEAVCATLSPQAGPAPPKFLVDIVRSIARRGGVATEAETQLLLRLEEIHQGCPTTPEEEEQIRRRVEEITRDGEPSERAAPPGTSPVRETTAGDAIWGAAFSPDGRLALYASMDGLLYADEVATGRRVQSFAGHTDGVTSVAVATRGGPILSGGLDGTLRLWDLPSGRALRRLEGHEGRVFRVALSADGRHAVSGGEDQTVRLWDVASGHEVRRFEGHAGWVTGVAFAPDGRAVVSCGDDGTVQLWDVDTGAERRRYEGHGGSVKSVVFSPDGGRILSGGEDGTVRLWDVVSGRELWRFTGHTDWVRDVAFSPQGDRVLTASDDETLRLLRADTGVEVACLQGPTASFLCVAVSPDGRRALSGSDDARARLWELPR